MRKSIVLDIPIIVVLSSAFLYYGYKYQKPRHKLNGPGFELSVLPSHMNQSSRFIGASVQVYMNNPPTIKQGIESYENVTPLFNGIVNSTGNLTSNLSYSFFQYVENWYNFFSSTNKSGANAALTIQITYYYDMGKYTYVSYYTNIITINPAYYMKIFNLDNKQSGVVTGTNVLIRMEMHPEGNLMKLYRVSSVKPEGIGGPGGPPWYMWVLEKEHTLSNYPIPLAWTNDSLVNNNNEQIDLGVFLVGGIMATYFHPGGVSYQNGTYSYNTLNNSFYTTPYVDGMYAVGSTSYTAFPPKAGQPNAIMLYMNGSITVDVYKEYYYSAGGWQPTNNIQSITGISSLNITSGYIEMGNMALARGSTWSLMEPHNLVKYLISSNYVKSEIYNISDNQSVEWGSIVDSISTSSSNTSSSNIWPGINSVISIGLSAIGIIAAADGWSPGSGWADLASDVLAISGMAPSIYGFVEGIVTNVNDNAFLFGESVTLQNLPILGSPNGLQMNVITNNMPMSIIGNPVTAQYNISVFDLLATSSI